MPTLRRGLSILLFAALSVAAASPARSEVRGVFVGVDHYAYAAVQPLGGQFSDLQGAVGDAIRIRHALNQAFGYDFDEELQTTCPENATAPRSLLLADQCATRAAVLGALDAQIAAAHSGDTLILYLAGHGSTVNQADFNRPNSQASSYHSTFLPYDARKPGADAPGDIFDVELYDRFVLASSRGIAVVAIADSCHSGTIFRADGIFRDRARSAPPLTTRYAVPAFPPPFPENRARFVSLSASTDQQEAFEGAYDGTNQVGGVFTTALVEAIARTRATSFIDLMAEVRARVIDGGHRAQNPQASGDTVAGLDRTGLVSAPAGAPPLDVHADGSRLSLPSDGALAGMTVGSRLALFATATEAVNSNAIPLAYAKVLTVEPYSTELVLDGPKQAPFPEWLYARETSHVAPRRPLAIGLSPQLEAPPGKVDRAAILAALLAIGGVQYTQPAQLVLSLSRGEWAIADRSGSLIANLGKMDGPAFNVRLRADLTATARVRELVTQAGRPTGKVALCVTAVQINAYDCSPESGKAPPAGLAIGKPSYVTVVNRDAVPRYVTVLAIGPDQSIRIVLPAQAGHDPPLPQGQPLQQAISTVIEDIKGCRYMAIATARPLDAAAWVQSGIDPIPTDCGGALDRSASPRANGAADDVANKDNSTAWATAMVEAK